MEYEIQGQSTAAEIKSQVNLIRDVMVAVMKDGTHYGKVPGCGDKPTLLKPGAEKLSLTFHLRPVIDNDRDIRIDNFQNGHREVTVYCHIMSASGLEIATGVGSCSTMESKYRYRGGEKIPTGEVVPKEYWNLKSDEKLQEAQNLIGGPGFGVAKIDGVWQICEKGEKMENPDIADTYNTVLKMAKKRAYVDGVLSATAASDIFTQDIEDMIPEKFNQPSQPSPKLSKEPIKKTTSKSGKENNAGQAQALVAVMMKAGASKDEINLILSQKVRDQSHITPDEFNYLNGIFNNGTWEQVIIELKELAVNNESGSN